MPPFSILSIDGGGIRGIIPAMILAEIEQRTGRRIAELFDLIAGTSTGGILTLGLTVPHQQKRNKPRYEASHTARLRGRRVRNPSVNRSSGLPTAAHGPPGAGTPAGPCLPA
jgi:patatin-like phospholipase/acyl hydrolase